MPFTERPRPQKMSPAEVPNAFFDVDRSDWTQDDVNQYDARLAEQDRAAAEQTSAERTYTFETPTLSADTNPTVEQVVSMLELGHVVKDAPRFKDQINDETRTNEIVFVSGQKEYLATTGYREQYNDQRMTISEHDALLATDQFFQDLAEAERQRDQDDRDEYGDDAGVEEDSITLGDDMREHLNFIGDKELNEAAAGLAEYWKAMLDTNPQQQILVPIGAYVKAEALNNFAVDATRVKSDTYVFGKIMNHFTEDEKMLYAGRLVTELSDVTARDPNDLRIILLDDWSISRKQLSDTAAYVRMELPQFASRVEVNLVVATDEQIQFGLAREGKRATLAGMNMAPLPVRAYYKAHRAVINQKATGSKAHITGAHSAVDYNFGELIQDELRGIASHADYKDRQLPETLQSLPPIVEIVRSYRPAGTAEPKRLLKNEIIEL